MKDRTTLTKSLHTVTAVSRLAAYLTRCNPVDYGLHPNLAAQDALAILIGENRYGSDDQTMAAAIRATERLLDAEFGAPRAAHAEGPRALWLWVQP
jgi:hypothetical protein